MIAIDFCSLKPRLKRLLVSLLTEIAAADNRQIIDVK